MKKTDAPLSLLQWKMLRWLAGGDAGQRSIFQRDGGDIFIFGADLRKEALRAAADLISRGWTTVDSHGNHRLNAAGMEAAVTLPEPAWRPPAPPALVERDIDVLDELRACCDSRYAAPGRFHSPYACGGTNGSHHSASLAKLCRHELVECRVSYGKVVSGDASVPRPSLIKRAKGSKHYRITERGRDLLERRKSKGPE